MTNQHQLSATAQQQKPTTQLQSAIILAGGRSSRMGQDKALLKLDGDSQLCRTVALAKAAGCDQILISRNQPGFINDFYPDAGPLAGIQAALLQVHASQCLILPVDTPLLNAALLTLLLQYPCACFAGSPLPAVIPTNQQVKQWLAKTLQHNTSAAKNNNKNTTSGLSVTALLQQFGVQQLPCPTPAALLNTNTPDEWQLALQQHQHLNPEASRYGQNT